MRPLQKKSSRFSTCAPVGDNSVIGPVTKPACWKGTLPDTSAGCTASTHAKREDLVYDAVGSGVAMLARMVLKSQSTVSVSRCSLNAGFDSRGLWSISLSENR